MAENNDEKISVISINQSGGITAHTVNINATPAPTLNAQPLFLNQPCGSEYHSRVALTIQSPYPPGNLYVAVSAPSVKSINLMPDRTGIVMFGHCGTRQGMAFANLQSPYGLIHLDIITGKPEQLNIGWNVT